MTSRLAITIFAVLWLLPSSGLAQQQFTDYEAVEDSVRLGPSEKMVIPFSERGYTLLLPEGKKEVNGLVVLFGGKRYTLKDSTDLLNMYPHAFEQNLGVLAVSTGNPVDFYFDEKNMLVVRDLIREALRKQDLSETDLFYAGMSLGGTMALRFTIFCKRNPSECGLLPDSVAVADAPLDMTRFWKYAERGEKLDFHPVAAGEGRWVSYYLEKNLGGTPYENPEAYVEYSPYTYTGENLEELGGNAQYLKDIPVRTYAEPDVNWNIEHRRRGYYSMNAMDMAGLVAALKIMGNNEAEFIATHNQRANLEGNPHSWSIVDEPKLMQWFVSTTDPE